MMHHHTLTALCVSAESVRQRARERVVITKLLHGGRARRGSCVRQSADGTFKSSGRGSSLLAAAISQRANFHLKEHSAPLPPPAPSPSSLFTVRHLSHLSPSSAAVHPSSPFFPRQLHRIHLTTFMPPFFFILSRLCSFPPVSSASTLSLYRLLKVVPRKQGKDLKRRKGSEPNLSGCLKVGR